MKNMMILMIVIMSSMLIGCSAQDDPTKVGWVGPLTGSAAVLGMDSVVAAQMAVDRINADGGIGGRQVVLIVEDDQYDTTKTVTAYQKLVQVDGVKVMLLTTYSSVLALADQANRDGVLIMDALDCNSDIANRAGSVACLATDSESIGYVLADHAKQQGTDKIGILYFQSDEFMPLVKGAFISRFGDERVISEAYVAGTSDFRTMITKFQEQGIDALVLLGYDETGAAMRQARELGFKGQFYATGTATSPSLQEAAQGSAEGTIIAFWDAPMSTQKVAFDAEFGSRQNRMPILDLASYPSYDAMIALGKALEISQEKEGIKKALQTVSFDGVTSRVRFDEQFSMRIPESAHVIKEGRAVALQ